MFKTFSTHLNNCFNIRSLDSITRMTKPVDIISFPSKEQHYQLPSGSRSLAGVCSPENPERLNSASIGFAQGFCLKLTQRKTALRSILYFPVFKLTQQQRLK
ncbi:hypothetical protein S245_047948 [Arachis hypogaea]